MLISQNFLFKLFVFTSVFFQIFIFNFNFLSSNIKIPQLLFLFLITYNLRSLVKIKLSNRILNYCKYGLFSLLIISFCTFFNYETESFNNLTSLNYKPISHLTLFFFNFLTVPFLFLLMRFLKIKQDIISTFYNSIFFSIIIIILILLLPFDSSFLFKENIEFSVSGLQIQRFKGGLEFSIFSVIALFSLLNDRQNKDILALKYFKITVFLISVLIGFSRQAFLCLIVGSIMHFFYKYNLSIKNIVSLFPLVLLLSFFLYIVVPNSIFLTFVFDRFTEIFSVATYFTGTASDRFFLWTNMINDISNNVLFGKGMDSYIKFFVYQGDGAHNLFMMILHAGGALALTLFLFAIIPIFYRYFNYRHYRFNNFIIFLSLSMLFLASLTSLIYTINLFWIFLGFAFYFDNKHSNLRHDKI